MVKFLTTFIAIASLATITSTQSSTPVIGGACKLGTSDVQIGGKQTQFFLKCESNSDSGEGQGIWVVKSRAAAKAPASIAPEEIPSAKIETPKTLSKLAQPTICEQDTYSKPGGKCSAPVTCLQTYYPERNSFLQCDESTKTWIKKYCKNLMATFSFEHQACVGAERPGVSRQSVSSGLVCTYASCSDSNPCSKGSCNNGYCCSSSSSSQATPKVIVIPQQSSSTCNGCNNNNNNALMISYCPGGGQSAGPCNSGYCNSGYSCVNNNCCPSASAPATITIQRCPNGQASAGYCNNGGCSSGYSCNSATNLCCAIVTATFVCSDGTQAAGGCVSGQCGTGYTCKSGLCCAETTDNVKCLDGTVAIGACINGNCGAGFVCTTGNICCPAVSASVCNKGGKSVGPCVNGYCPRGMYCDDLDGVGEGNCCTTSPITCSSTENIGSCIGGSCPDGHLCDTDNEWCCPTYDTAATNQVGECIDTADGAICPDGFVCGLGNFCYATSDYKADCYAMNSIGVCTIIGDTRECPDGYTCSGYDVAAGTAGYCCPTTTVMRARRRHPGRKVESFLSQVLMHDNAKGDIDGPAVEKLAN